MTKLDLDLDGFQNVRDSVEEITLRLAQDALAEISDRAEYLRRSIGQKTRWALVRVSND